MLGAVVCQGAEAEGFHGAASVLRNLAALPSAKSAIVKAGLVPALLEMMFQGSSQEERDSAKAILRNLAFNSEEHASIVQQLAGEGCSVDELLA